LRSSTVSAFSSDRGEQPHRRAAESPAEPLSAAVGVTSAGGRFDAILKAELSRVISFFLAAFGTSYVSSR
jgi:hypothetical protein